MNTGRTDVVVHISTALDERQRDRLLERLGAEEGVTRVRSDGRSGQLFIIDYDRRAISALGVLRCVQAQGYAARLVGM